MAEVKFIIEQQRRPANYTPNKHRAVSLNIEQGMTIPVHVLGLYQYSNGDEADAYFIIELQDGNTAYANVCEIQFTEDKA